METMRAKAGTEKQIFTRNIVISILVITFFVAIILVYNNMLYMEKRRGIIRDGEMSADRAETEVNQYLATSVDALQLTAYTLDGMMADHKSSAEMLDYLTGQSTAVINAVFENTKGIYGFVGGEYLDGAGWVPDEDYVPTERPWYIKAVANHGEVTVIEPYVDAQTGTVVMSLAKALSDGESVISMDIYLDRIQKITEEAVASGEADIVIIMDDRSMVIAHSDKDEVGKDYSTESGTFGATLLEKLNNSTEDFFDFSYTDGQHYIVYQSEVQNGWRCLSVQNATKVFKPLQLILVVTVALVAVIVIVLSTILNNSNKKTLIAEKLNAQLSSTAEIYRVVRDFNIIDDTFSEIQTDGSGSADVLADNHAFAQQTFYGIMENAVDPVSRDELMRFINFATLDERLKEQRTLTIEFLTTEGLWLRGRFIVSQRDADGSISHVLWLVEDIDEEKRHRDMMYEALKTMNEQIASVANIYFSMHDVDLMNDTFCELRTNVDRISQLVGNNMEHAQESMNAVMDQMTHKKSKAAIREFTNFSTLSERLRNRDTITEEFLSYRDIWCRARFVVSKRNPDGTVAHVLWLVEGIDEEKRRRDKLAEAAETLNYRIASIADIYMSAYELDLASDTFTEIKTQRKAADGADEGARLRAQSMLYRMMESVTDSSCIEDVRRFVDLSTLAERLRDTGTITIEYKNKGGLWRRGRFIASRRDENGKLARALWLAEDIDQEKKERDKLIDMSERAIAASEAKSSFLSNMSHEIRTPINAVLGMNEMVLRESDDLNILAYSESIRTAGTTLLGIVNDILDFSKIEAGKMEIIPVDYDLSSVINDLVNMIQARADAKGLLLKLDFDGTMPKLLCGDEVRIKQVITNILTNAVKYTEKGSVTFHIGYERAEDESNDIYLNVAISDTGIGIKPEDMKKLFSEFERIEEKRNRNIEGTGLGMTITKRLLEMMKSALKVESVYGKGSTFSFRLRQKVVKWEELGDYEASYRASLSGRKKSVAKFSAPDAIVLVVDDTPMNLMVFKSLLKRTDVQIDTAASGDEGLALAFDRKYDMI
ncbi:MAG: hypothetical protein E7425_07140, partial [Ruminococcaceae bacterium]|nr:hypothetical protein [Oscillospiraceae bacterium]